MILQGQIDRAARLGPEWHTCLVGSTAVTTRHKSCRAKPYALNSLPGFAWHQKKQGILLDFSLSPYLVWKSWAHCGGGIGVYSESCVF
jgi:hypothetical protein